jgi:hypothetical protein
MIATPNLPLTAETVKDAAHQAAWLLGEFWQVRVVTPVGELPRIVAEFKHAFYYDAGVTAWFETDAEGRTFLRYDEEIVWHEAKTEVTEHQSGLAVMIAENAISKALYPIEGWR